MANRRHLAGRPAINERPSLLKNPAIGRAAAALAAYEGAKQLWGTGTRLYREYLVYTVVVDETDHLYGDVHEWLVEAVPGEKHRSLRATTTTARRPYYEEDDGEDRKPAPVTLSFNDRRSKTIDVAGHKVQAHMRRTEDVPDAASKKLVPMCIEFSARTRAGQQAVIRKLEELQANKGVRKPVLRIVNQWGNWVRRSDLPLRDLDSVVLPDEQREAIVGDLRDFLEAEDRYVRLALPWHRGYMLHGPPGTGKTSLVKAIANEFNLDLWYISLGDLKEEASLINLLADVSPRSILLLEDVDTIELTNDADAPGAKARPTQLSLGSLLNALDGVATPHGLITFMTTNHFEKLDERLVRAGRMDRVEELDYPTAREVDAMYRRFYGAPMPGWEPGSGRAPFSQAQLSEAFKRNLGDPAGAAKAVRSLWAGAAL